VNNSFFFGKENFLVKTPSFFKAHQFCLTVSVWIAGTNEIVASEKSGLLDSVLVDEVKSFRF